MVLQHLARHLDDAGAGDRADRLRRKAAEWEDRSRRIRLSLARR
jgi:hypothetical protein